LTARTIKTPKVYFADTGLACYLTKWNTPETLESGAFSGAIFETYAVSEIIKSNMHNGQEPSIYFYRDRDGIEIDVILEENGALYPIEIKKKSNPDKGDIKNFGILSKYKKSVGTGAVLCLAPAYLPLSDQAWIVPAGYV
jgi:predicted AAA+ superfamily ATPase